MRDPSDPYADERQATGPTAHELWEAQQARQARANRAQAIRDCQLCDSDGYRGTRVCDHQDHTPAAKRGMDEIRAKMGWPATGTPTHP
ncbi:hypothetical protein [Mycolicibacterium fortuitum]|uniref:hypothetical protein n=1 Tax=Mycolicibacterium fortuitum TaxID=1766 RepID=UPI0010546A97|nr:hypothetical protein [Mycolicibacterium fortuitum]